MHGDLLDLILLAAIALFAVSGYRQGFVVGVLSFLGFLGGGVLGATIAPTLLRTGPLSHLSRTPVAIGLVFLLASLGQVIASVGGAWVRKHLVWKPARVVDAIAGAGISVVSLLLVAWLVGTAVASSPFTGLASQVRRSQVLAVVDDTVPGGAKSLFDSFRSLVDDRGFPEVFGDLVPTQVRKVDPPDAALARSAVVTAVRDRIFKITGVARSCSRRIEGTGFLYAPHRVMTNAHVVAGVRSPKVHVGDREVDSTVVLYDPNRDIAVLDVPDVSARPLVITGRARTGESAIVIGYPQDGPYRADPARVRGIQEAKGPNIYDNRTVIREIYALRARVRPGNSGGPLVSTQGRVLGVVFAAAADDPQTGYALTAKEVASDAAAGRTATGAVSTGRCD
ncbi:MAG TPA: MarP family serine protease [Mycobacteriales bacterium]|nr:MarP family serine protease [Mycobacteriales bacterium]